MGWVSVSNTAKKGGLEGLNIVVCVKQVLDPEIPPAKFRIDAAAKKVIPPEGIPPVINPYDAQAVELALRLKEKHGGRITILSLGPEAASSVVKHALSMGADDGYLLVDPAFAGGDSFFTAYLLSQAVKKIGAFDLVLCGRQAADWDEGLVGSLLAAYLDLPLVTLAAAAELVNGELRVKRMTLDGYQVFGVPLPAVVTVSNEVGRPRLPSGWGIISAAKKQVPVWKAGDLGVVSPAENPARRQLVELYLPVRTRRCEIIAGENAAEAAARLADRLREKGVV